MFVEMLVMYECYLPIAQKFEIPVIGTVSLRPWPRVDTELGNSHPFHYPFLLSHRPIRMSFYERLQNVLDHIGMEYRIYHQIVGPKLQKFYKSHFPFHRSNGNTEISFLFANWHSSIFPRIRVPAMAEIGGIHIQPAKSLPSVC